MSRLLLVMGLWFSAQPAHADDFPRCEFNFDFRQHWPLSNGQTVFSPQFNVLAGDRVYLRARGAATTTYSVTYELQRLINGSWVTLNTRSGSTGADSQLFITEDSSGDWRLRVTSTGSGEVRVHVVVVWHENPTCRDAFDIKPNTTNFNTPVDGCFGAAGGNCDGLPIHRVSVSPSGMRLLKNVPGAQKHDTCCNVQNPYWTKQSGLQCGGSTTYDGSPIVSLPGRCDAEYAAAAVDVEAGNGVWQWFDASTIYLTGTYMANRAPGAGDFISPSAGSPQYPGSMLFSNTNLQTNDVNGGWCAGASGFAFKCCTFFPAACGGVIYSPTLSCPSGTWLQLQSYKHCF